MKTVFNILLYLFAFWLFVLFMNWLELHWPFYVFVVFLAVAVIYCFPKVHDWSRSPPLEPPEFYDPEQSEKPKQKWSKQETEAMLFFLVVLAMLGILIWMLFTGNPMLIPSAIIVALAIPGWMILRRWEHSQSKKREAQESPEPT